MPNLLRCCGNCLEIVPMAPTTIGAIWYEYLGCNCCNSLTSSIYLSILVICLLLTLKSRGAFMSITVHFISCLSQMIISGRLCFTLLTVVTRGFHQISCVAVCLTTGNGPLCFWASPHLRSHPQALWQYCRVCW